MKKPSIIVTIALAGLLAAPATILAQEQGQQRRTPEEQVKALKESLKLTDEQAEKIKAIFAKGQEKRRALREDQNLSQEDRRAKMREIQTAQEEEIKPILTPEQQTKWKEELEKRRAERGQRGNQ
jgi:protein CpxP